MELLNTRHSEQEIKHSKNTIHRENDILQPLLRYFSSKCYFTLLLLLFFLSNSSATVNTNDFGLSFKQVITESNLPAAIADVEFLELESVLLNYLDSSIVIKRVGEPSLCDLIGTDASHPLASIDCDGGTVDNYTECQNGSDPTNPEDDIKSCNFNFDMTYTFNDAGTCRFYVTLGCDDTACPVTSWDYDISAGTVSITGTSTTSLNAPTSNSFRPSVLGCGNTIRITRKDFATAFPAGFGEDITFTLTANSSSCGCSETATVIIPRMNALTFDNQGPQRDATGTTSWVQANGDYVNGSATAMSSWPMPPPLPNWGVGGPTFIAAAHLSTGDLVCAPVGWATMTASAGMSICEVTLADNTVITLPPGCAVPTAGSILSTTIADALNACNTFISHSSIQNNGLCSSVGTKYDGNLTSGVHACVNWNFMYSAGYAIKTFKICDDATGTVIGEFVFGDASVDYGY